MPVSSLIIRTDIHRTEQVRTRLDRMQCIDVETVDGANIVIVTVTVRQQQDKELWKAIEDIPGVLQCDLIYHNFEDDPVNGRSQD